MLVPPLLYTVITVDFLTIFGFLLLRGFKGFVSLASNFKHISFAGINFYNATAG